jgi:hypothetical protein
MNSVRFNTKSIPLAFAIVTILAYGLLAPLTGFYWDDWPFAWIAKFMGPAEFIPAFLGFRPFLGPIFFVTSSLIPPNPLLWQIFAVVIRFLAALSAWFALDQVWPDHKRQTLVVSLLFLVFPGYSQHWIAYTHINQEWIPLICYLISFGLSACALRNPRQFWSYTIFALLFLAVGVFPTEYFIGLEPLRFLFFLVIAAEGTHGFRPLLSKTLRNWWPYLLVWVADLAWLIYFYKSGVYVSYDLTAAQTLPPLGKSLVIFADALWKAGFYAWVQVLFLVARTIRAPTSLATLLLIVVAFLLCAFYLLRLQLSPPVHMPIAAQAADASPGKWWRGRTNVFAVSAIAMGVLGILLGRVPSFAAGLPLTLQSGSDRFMISMMLGGSLLVTGLVELLARNERTRIYILAGLIALGIGQQFFNGNLFRRDWQGQQQIYWQFAWRIPALLPQTAVITQQMPLDNETDLSMTAALNWIYAPQIHPRTLAYALIYSEKRLGGVVLPNLEVNTPIQLPYRTVDFNGSTSQAIVIYVPPNGCLRVFDPAFDDTETYAKFPKTLIAPIPLSNPGRILTDLPSPKLPDPPFSAEPPHAWCYYYEKAELARQARDWQGIGLLGTEATQLGFAPQDLFEWLPFIEAYARTGDLKSAEQITRRVWNTEPKVHRGLCLLWRRVRTDGPAEVQMLAAKVIGEFDCGE